MFVGLLGCRPSVVPSAFALGLYLIFMKPLTLIASTDTKVLIDTFVQWFCLCIFGLIVETIVVKK